MKNYMFGAIAFVLILGGVYMWRPEMITRPMNPGGMPAGYDMMHSDTGHEIYEEEFDFYEEEEFEPIEERYGSAAAA